LFKKSKNIEEYEQTFKHILDPAYKKQLAMQNLALMRRQYLPEQSDFKKL